MTGGNSYRTILRSSAISGAASVTNILVGLIRMKVAAVLLGPAGIGLIGLLQNLMATAAAVSAFGFGSVGTRQIADAAGNGRDEDVATARRALFWGTLGLALLGAAVFFLLRHVLAERILGDTARAGELGWLALGVALTVASGSQSALLNGLRRIGDLARLQIASAILSTAISVPTLLLWGEGGIAVFILGGPLASFLLGHWFVSRLDRVRGAPTPLRTLASQWRIMARLGIAFMVSGLVVSAGMLGARAIIQDTAGTHELGQFQAAWAISMTYLGFVLSAMGTDYYPRLTAAMTDRESAVRLVNEQIEVALLLAGPAFIAMLALAPVVVHLLYSPQFAPAASILRWQVLGDILKTVSWPLGFVLLAAGAGKIYMLAESVAIGVFVLGVWIGLPLLGIEATGIAFLVMYVVYLPVVFWLGRRRLGFAWRPAVVRQMLLLLAIALLVLVLARVSEPAAMIVGCAAAAALGLHGLGRLGAMAELGGRLGQAAALGRRLTGVARFRVG